LREDWAELSTSRWALFGQPSPIVVTDSALGRAFLNNGDGTYFSGAYLKQPLDARSGVWLETTMSVPITRPIHQYLSITIRALRDVSRMQAEWDHVTGYLPTRFGDINPMCEMTYPSSEGFDGALALTPLGALARAPGARLPRLATGLPTRVVMQAFPDGRCGIALDGERPLISGGTLPRLDSLFVLIQGNSVGTRMLVGPMRIGIGIAPGIDWFGGRIDQRR
jgi:hypothetical protein